MNELVAVALIITAGFTFATFSASVAELIGLIKNSTAGMYNCIDNKVETFNFTPSAAKTIDCLMYIGSPLSLAIFHALVTDSYPTFMMVVTVVSTAGYMLQLKRSKY